MKGLRRKFRRGLAGFLAFVLTMTSFNMVSWADVASAFETEKATFVMSGEEIRESAQAAIDSGSTFHFEDLGIEESEDNAKDYQKLFGSGSVYEIAPSYNMSDDEDADGADLRVFVRIKDDYEGYRLTGKEEIIFLYINDSEGKISFRTIVDGYATERITVKGNSKLAEAEVPGNVNGTLEGEVTTPEENRTPEGEVTTPEESGTPEGEVTTPEENRTPEEEVTTPEENGTLEGESDNEDAAMSEDNTVVSISRNSSAVLMSADSTVTVLESANEKNDKITLATASNSENSNSGKSDPKESSSVANLVNGKVYGNVILDESSYARAYVITLDALNIEQPLNEYQIKVTHRLHGDNWIDYEKIETVTITDNDFDNGEYDTAKLEFKREGIVLTSQSLVLTKDAFKSGTEAEITLEYAVADGYRIYDNRANLRSIFVGELDDDDPVIKPVGQAVVNIKYVYENGTIAKDTESVAALYDENTKKYKLTYELGDLDGYKPVLDTMDSASGITLDGNILTANLSEDKEYLAVIVYMADTVEYVVRHNYQKLDGSYEVKESETKSGKAGELSAAVAQNVTGFTPKQISQKELSATEENIVDIFYDRNIYDLTYSTDGGEYVERQTGLYGESLTVAKSTTKAGYLFDGWYTDKNFSQGTRVSGSIVLEDNTILYAKWNPGTVGYKVVYLIENADDNNYSLLCTDAKTGKTGDNVQITAKTANPTNWGELEKNAFTFKDSTSEVLKADGTSIVTVRYSRNTYTIRFQDKSPTLCRMESHTHTLSNCYKRTCNKLHKHNESCYDMSYTICGLTEHQHDSTCYTRDISAKYQANIREQWLENYGGHNWLWSGSSYTSLQDIMPYVSGNGIKVLNKHNDGPTPRPLEYYVEDPNGTIKDPKGGSTKFSLYTKITIYLEKGSTPSWDEEYYEIDGYERYYTNIDFSRPSFKNPSTFYYTRAKYDLTLINGTNETTKKDIPYKSDISKYLGAPTVNPTSDATFDAWYVDSSFTEKYTSGTMPKGNLVLYAHWNNAAYDVTFKDGQEILDTVEVNSGELVTPISTPEKAGYSFTGWYIDEACTQRYDFQRKVESDFDLYAGWSMHSTTSYQILYVTSEGDPVADSVTGNGVIGDTIQANAVVPTIAGYEDYIVDKATASISLDADPNKNVIRFIYSSPESLRYTVQYWYEDKIVAEEANIASKLSSFRCYPNTDLEQLTGYKVKEAYKNVKLTTGENIIKFTLTLNEYTITYENVDYNDIVWENGNTNPTKYNIHTNSFTLKNPGRVGYTFMGWKLVKGSVESGEYDSKNVVIETGSRGNLTFKAEWAVDVNQKLNYSIKYYKSEQPDKEIGNLNKNVLVASPTVKYADVDKTYNKPSGYILDKVEFGGQTVSDGEMTITDTDNIIKVYYKVDETQKLKYSVEYYIDGKDIPFDKLDNQEVLVADPVVSEVADSSKVPAGYTRDSVLPELPATISETANVIRVYYKVDETQKLKYSVEYYVNGNDTAFDKLENQEVLAADPVVKAVADSSKVPAGYTRDSVSPKLPTTISSSNNIIRVYYKVDETQKLKYSVEYYVTGNDTAFDKLENQEVLVADPVVKAVADSSKVPAGYTRDSVLPELPATISETANVIKVYYRVDETQKLKYSVEYYINGNDTAFDKLENQEVLAADPVVKAVADSSKVPAGYRRDSVSPELPVTITESSNIIKVYYRIDTTQKLQFDVEYYLVGEMEAFDAVRNQTVLVANPVINAVADSSKVPAGYERASVMPQLPTIISKTNNVIRVYYKVDETQKLKYSIEYYVTGNETAFDKLENQEVLVANPVVSTVADSSKVPAGYTRDRVLPELPTTISGSNNVIRVYYKVDETQKLKYSVEYYLNGNDTAFDKLENQEVLVADPVVKAVADSSKVPAGYTRDSVLPELPATISETANVIKVYYRVDETQKLKYSVEYYVNGNDTAFDKLENQEVLAADPVVKAVADSSKVPAGYTRDSVSPKLPTTISSSNNIIRVYYKVDETQKLKYSVEYYVTGNDTAFDKLENQEVLVADPVVKAVADSSKVPAGYTRDSVLPELPATISETANVIKVYYRVDETQKLKYSIEYYVNGNDAAFDKLENQEVLVADPVVASVADSNKVPAGYTRDHVMPELPTTITESNHVIRVYYRVDETQKLRYDVEYYVDGNDTAFDKLENQEVLVANPVVNAVVDSSKVPAGYTRNSVLPELPTMISESNNIIKVYYSVDEMQKLKYNVEYYINGSATAFDKLENQEVLVADPYVLFVKDSALVSAGYVRDRVEPLLPAKIVHDGDIINVYYRARTDLYSEINYYYDDTKTDTQKDNNAVFDTGILDGVKVEMEVTHTDGKHYVLDRIEGKDKKVTVNPTENIVNIYYALDEKGTGTDPNKPDNIPDKYQITFTYVAGENGNVDGQKEEVITRELDADGSFSSINPAYPGALVKANANNGYSFQNWTSDEVGMMAGKPVSTFADEAAIREAGFITDTVFTAHFNAKEDTSYRIEYYYEVQGQYPATTNNYEVRTGKTDTTVSVTDNDKIKAGYKYDTEAANVVSGVVKGDNSLVLRLYFKQQFTVTYQSGNHDFFEEQVIGENSYGDKTPVFTGEMNIRGNYVFNGWQPVIAEKVTENAVYVAQWRYTGSSGGDTGGGGNTPSDNKPYVPNGPGDTVTIEPGDVPLANVPENGPVDNLMLIDDGNVPLAGLPKTGDRFGTNTGLAALLTGFLLAAFTALNNKRREEENK